MKNRMDVPQEYEPVLPGKVEAHLAKKKAQAAENSLLTQTAIAVGKAIAQLRPVSFDTLMCEIFHLMNSEISNPLVSTTSVTSFPVLRKRASTIDENPKGGTTLNDLRSQLPECPLEYQIPHIPGSHTALVIEIHAPTSIGRRRCSPGRSPVSSITPTS